MFPSLSIRSATIKDLSSILTLYAQPSLDNGQVLPLQEAEQRFTQGEFPNSIYVAEVRGEIIGTFRLVILSGFGECRGVFAPAVAVAPEWQGKKIGRDMMDNAFQKCLEAGCKTLTLSSNFKRERAHRFYENVGFKRNGYSFYTQVTPEFPLSHDVTISQDTSEGVPTTDVRVYQLSYKGKRIGDYQLLILRNLAHQGTCSAVIENWALEDDFRTPEFEAHMVRFALEQSKNENCYKLAVALSEKTTEYLCDKLGVVKHGVRFEREIV